MKRTTQILGSVSAVALAGAPTVAMATAVGTSANTVISNSVTVNYSVGGNSQTTITSVADTFTVDRKINLDVTTQDTAAVTVTPGQTNAVTTFVVTNNSNATIDFLLAATQQSGGPAKFSGSDDSDVSNVRVYVETNNTSGWQSGDTAANAIKSLASGDSVTVYVVADVPTTAALDEIASVILTAQAFEGTTVITGYAANAGAGATAITALTATDANNKNAMDTIFADGQAETETGDGLHDGKYAARSDYRVDAAQLAVSKISRITSDPINGALTATNFPKAIPGATVEYCILLSNASTTQDATDVVVSDQIDTTTLESISVPYIGASYANGACSGGTASTWSIDSSTTPATYSYDPSTPLTVPKNTATTAPVTVRFTAVIK